HDHVAHALALLDLIDHVLHERPTGFGGDHLPGKSGGGEAGGNHNGRSQSRPHQKNEKTPSQVNFKLRGDSTDWRGESQIALQPVAVISPESLCAWGPRSRGRGRRGWRVWRGGGCDRRISASRPS